MRRMVNVSSVSEAQLGAPSRRPMPVGLERPRWRRADERFGRLRTTRIRRREGALIETT